MILYHISECLDLMLCMFSSHIMYSKVINNEGEVDGSGFVGPYYWGEFNRLISVLLQVIFKYVMCDSSRLCKTIHVLLNTNIDCSIVRNVIEVILIDYLLGYHVKGKLHVSVMFSWCIVIKVCYV